MRTTPRHFAYADLTLEEWTAVKAAAAAEHLSIANFVRRCVNAYLAELSDDGLLIAEHHRSRAPKIPALHHGRPRKADRWT